MLVRITNIRIIKFGCHCSCSESGTRAVEKAQMSLATAPGFTTSNMYIFKKCEQFPVS